MDNERKDELQKGLENSTFVEKGEVSVETVSESPKVFVEEKSVEDRDGVDVKKNSVKVAQKSTSTERNGLGYNIDDNEEDFNEISDYTSANVWRKALKDKKIA